MIRLNLLRSSIDYLESLYRGRGARWHIEHNPDMDRFAAGLREKLLRVEQLESAVTQKLGYDCEALRFYFENYDDSDNELDKEANGICAQLFRYTADVYNINVSEAIEKLLNTNDEYIWLSACYVLLPSNDIHNPPKTFSEYEKLIMALPYREERRLAALNICENKARYLEELGTLLLAVENAILECHANYAALLEEFEARYLNNAFLAELAAANIVDVESFSKVEIHPSLFDNGLFSMIAPFESEDIAIVNMGVCFWDIFLIRATSVSDQASGMREIIKLLADKTRMDIILYLKNKESYGQELSREFNLSRNAIYKHMNKLLEYNLVKCKATKKKVLYSLNMDTFRRFISALAGAILDE